MKSSSQEFHSENNSNVEILDCTIRDGSYVIDGQWTEDQIRGIVEGLDRAGFKYIEIGPGIGLGASRKGVASCCSDNEQTQIAVHSADTAKIAAFFIPGVGEFQDLKDFADAGGSMVRIGTDVSESHKALPYIEYAKKQGLIVGYNFMKSYVVGPFDICRRATEIYQAGADAVWLVDSAGGMLPREVGSYVDALKGNLPDLPVGFHGHNNFLLANANNIAAIENGAQFVDCTLRGMGRGAGNAQSETMLAILERMGVTIEINLMLASKVSKQFIEPLALSLKGADHTQLVTGYARFHDSYMSMMEAVASQFGIPVDQLIIEVCKIDQEKPSRTLVERVATQISLGKIPEVFFPRVYRRPS